MTVAIFQGEAAAPLLPTETEDPVPATERKMVEEKERLDIWSSIQKEREKRAAVVEPYVHPLVRHSSSLMSQKSLEICTESLGSETGSDWFSSGDELDGCLALPSFEGDLDYDEEEDEVEKEEEAAAEKQGRKKLTDVNYHCSIGWRSPPQSFPPPLSSISRGTGPCIQMKLHRRDGRLVIWAVPVPAQSYLHAERHGGRLRLSFMDASCQSNSKTPSVAITEKEEAEEEEEEEEEEVEVVDRGTVVEVKVITQPVSGAAAVKVHRSSLVINKFVIGNPLAAGNESPQPPPSMPHPPAKRTTPATATVAAAAVAASSISTSSTHDGFHYNYIHPLHLRPWGPQSLAAAAAAEAKLLFASKRRSREELLHDMQRCSELRRPLFIFEQPCCIATSSCAPIHPSILSST